MTEGTLMRLPATPINSLTPLTSPNTPNGHTPTLSNGTSPQFHPLAQYNNESSNGSTPTPTLKIERPTPTATPTSGLPLTPNPMGTPLLHHPNFTAIMEPVQNMPLDLHIGDPCEGSESDPNASLDYVLNSNGSATCRLCGELLPSRNHWYRHKYKTHASAHYRCDECGVVYKSKRGYETHMEVKHAKVKSLPTERPRRRDWDGVNRDMEDAKRKQEEAMVKAIIARVKIECAMEGEDCSRRGYQKH